MSKSTLILDDLKDALQVWEDVNMYSDALFQLSNLLGKNGLPNFYLKPLVGSEVDENGSIRRAIKNFQGFRHLVENRMEIADPTLFLPRVPTAEREEYPKKLDFFRRDLVHNLCFFPFTLSRWVEFKKVFAMDALDIIEPANIYEKNYLDKLPYGSFIIKLAQPVKIFFRRTQVEREFGTMLITSDDTVIDILFIQNNVKEWCMPSKSKKSLQGLSFKKTKDLLKQFKKIPLFNPDMKCEGFSVEIATGLKWIANLILPDGACLEHRWNLSDEIPKMVGRINGNSYRDGSRADEPDVLDILDFQKRMINILNGFCKFISELPPQQKDIVLGNSNSIPPQKYELTEWNAIPITNVFYLREGLDEGTNKKVLVLSHGGGEKPPHWRRKHKRTYKSGKVVWIEKTFVRFDKLENENLKGSASIVKDREP